MESCLQRLGSLLWGRGTVLFVLGVGLYFTLATGLLPITRGGTVCRRTVGSLFARKAGGVAPFAAMSAALGGTMGVGNIIGVGVALGIGGPGSVFWMWMGALAGMMTKYAEVLLAVKYRQKQGGVCLGGPMYYMSRGLPWAGGKLLAVWFSLACIAASMGIGNMTQVSAISQSLWQAFRLPVAATGFLVTGICALVVLGGSRRILRVSSAVVPAMAGLYLLGAAGVLLRYRHNLLPALQKILEGAFSPLSAAGATAGLLGGRAIQVGISRGIFTNEAGLGSAPIAHACADTHSCVEQGFWGIFEVFADTILVCTVTALAILASGVPAGPNATAQAFSLVWGEWGGGIIAVAVSCFALASVFGWCLYGQRAVGFLFPGKAGPLRWYNRLFLAGCFVGCVAQVQVVWLGADILNACMMLPNLVALLLLSPQVLGETRRYWGGGAL